MYRKSSVKGRGARLKIRRLPLFELLPGQKAPPIRTQARSATILPIFIGHKFQIHNGKSYTDITVTEDMVGRKLGEFAPYAYPEHYD